MRPTMAYITSSYMIPNYIHYSKKCFVAGLNDRKRPLVLVIDREPLFFVQFNICTSSINKDFFSMLLCYKPNDV